MSAPIHFHHPRFDKSIPDTVCKGIGVVSDGFTLKYDNNPSTGEWWDSAGIASKAIPTTKESIHIFVCHLRRPDSKIRQFRIGFTSEATCTGGKNSGESTVLRVEDGGIVRNKFIHEIGLEADHTKTATEVISILRVDSLGRKTAQWIVDGKCSINFMTSFETPARVFPCVLLAGYSGSEIHFVPFDQVRLSSPEIETWREEYEKQKIHKESGVNEKNEEIISGLKERVLKLETSLEKEMQQHEKTKEKLHQSQLEMKSMEIHFLKQQNEFVVNFYKQQQQNSTKESGKRREREEEDEDSDDEDEKKAKGKKKPQPKKAALPKVKREPK